MKKLLLAILALSNTLFTVWPFKQTKVQNHFLLTVEDVITIPGVGTFAIGKIESGVVKVGDAVQLVDLNSNAKPKSSIVIRVEMLNPALDEGKAGELVGLCLRGIEKEDIRSGMIIATAGSVVPQQENNV